MVGATALSLEGLVAVDADVVRLRRGDLNALSELITRYQNRLYRYLLRIVRQPAEAEDLFQQTWLRVVEKIRSFDASSNFDAWLFTLARNLAIDHLRRIRPQSLDDGVRLLARTTRSVTATTAGDSLLNDLAPALDRIRQSLSKMGELRHRPTGRIRLVMPRTAALMVLLPKLKEFIGAFPEIALDVATSNDPIELVAAGFDAGIHIGN